MNKSMGQWLRRVRPGRVVLHGRQRGQSLIIIVFAFIGLLALVGLAVDLGLVYVERVRIARAADAAALAGVSELPFEEAAHTRALMYLQENGYDYTNSSKVRVVINPGAGDSTEQVIEMEGNEMITTTIVIDTAFSRDQSAPVPVNTSNRIRVKIVQQVPMTFLQFVGFRRFPVEGSAEAENISNLDIVVVYDRSGSMEFDTVCYGCWDPYYPSGTQAAVCSDPDGCLYPLRWSQSGPTAPADHCAGWVSGDTFNCGSYSSSGAPSGYVKNDCNYRTSGTPYRYYTVIEAEEYSSLEELAGYQDWSATPYKTWWAIQRNTYNYYHGVSVGSTGRDSRNGYVSHHPFAAAPELGGIQGGLGVQCTWGDLNNGGRCRSKWPNGDDVPGPPGGFYAPRLDYKFTAPASTNYYVWIRGQGGGWDGDDTFIFWGLDQVPLGREGGFSQGPSYDGARSDRWSWRRLSKGEAGDQGDSVTLTQGQTYVLNLWGGGAGFSVDRIIITTDSTTSLPLTSASANNGRTDDVCDRCDPRFGGWDPTVYGLGLDELERADSWWLPHCDYGPEENRDQRQDDIYSGELPIRDALDGAERFISRMDFRLDQVGYVRYSNSSSIANELECLRQRGPENLGDAGCNPAACTPGGNPPCDPDCGCYSSVITNTVLYQLNNTRASGGTNIADAIADGIDVLSTGGSHFGRPGAAHIMVLMTDGEANEGGGCGAPADLWPEDNEPAKDCVIYYAKEARDNGIVIYTIALGWSADSELMQAVADMTGGEYREAKPVTQASLDAIFNELFERIFLRLVF